MRQTLLSNIPNQDKNYKENFRPIYLMNIDLEIISKIPAYQFNRTLKGSYSVIKWDLPLRCNDGSMYTNQ